VAAETLHPAKTVAVTPKVAIGVAAYEVVAACNESKRLRGSAKNVSFLDIVRFHPEASVYENDQLNSFCRATDCCRFKSQLVRNVLW
jgi:hypothetical protein